MTSSSYPIGVEVHIALRENDGKWLAATKSAPYFCFECESRESAIAQAKAAVHFYRESRPDIEEARSTRERESAVPHFRDAELLCA